MAITGSTGQSSGKVLNGIEIIPARGNNGRAGTVTAAGHAMISAVGFVMVMGLPGIFSRGLTSFRARHMMVVYCVH